MDSGVSPPLLDRYSPLAYSIGDYIHRVIANHGGYENCFRESLNYVFIFQGTGLFRELGADCVICQKLRGKYIEASMAPLSDHQLTIAPAFWITMADIMGPVHIYVPGHTMKTRNKQVMEVKCYVLMLVCATTKNVNLQVIEGKGAYAVIEGINRLGCEVGFPSYFLVDQDSGILKALKEAKVNLKDLQQVVYKERGIKFKTCPVSGHNYHGAVERRIRSVEECLQKAGVYSLRLHATGLQTVLKLIENDMNNNPLGYMYGRDSDNSPLLKLIFPNMLRTGRINKRSLDGPITLPKGPADLMSKIEKAYDVFYKIWNSVMVPKMMKQNKWYKEDEELKPGDVIYFQKEEGDLASKWSLGLVHEVVRGKDQKVRRISIKYQNAGETIPRYTDRAARSTIKLFNIEDSTWQDDMRDIEKLREDLLKIDQGEYAARVIRENVSSTEGSFARSRLSAVGGYQDVVALERHDGVQNIPRAKAVKLKFLKSCSSCCCFGHCTMESHADLDSSQSLSIGSLHEEQQSDYYNLWDFSWFTADEFAEELVTVSSRTSTLTDLLSAIHVDLSDVDISYALGS